MLDFSVNSMKSLRNFLSQCINIQNSTTIVFDFINHDNRDAHLISLLKIDKYEISNNTFPFSRISLPIKSFFQLVILSTANNENNRDERY